MALSQAVRDRLSQSFGITNDELTAAKELADAVDNASAVSGGDIASNGTVPFTANQPMGNNKLTGLSAGTTAGDSLRFEQIMAYASSAGAGGAASATLTVTGLLSTDTVLAVSQKVAGANSLPLLGWTTVANNALTVQWSADPGAGSIVVVSVKR